MKSFLNKIKDKAKETNEVPFIKKSFSQMNSEIFNNVFRVRLDQDPQQQIDKYKKEIRRINNNSNQKFEPILTTFIKIEELKDNKDYQFVMNFINEFNLEIEYMYKHNIQHMENGILRNELAHNMFIQLEQLSLFKQKEIQEIQMKKIRDLCVEKLMLDSTYAPKIVNMLKDEQLKNDEMIKGRSQLRKTRSKSGLIQIKEQLPSELIKQEMIDYENGNRTDQKDWNAPAYRLNQYNRGVHFDSISKSKKQQQIKTTPQKKLFVQHEEEEDQEQNDENDDDDDDDDDDANDEEKDQKNAQNDDPLKQDEQNLQQDENNDLKKEAKSPTKKKKKSKKEKAYSNKMKPAYRFFRTDIKENDKFTQQSLVDGFHNKNIEQRSIYQHYIPSNDAREIRMEYRWQEGINKAIEEQKLRKEQAAKIRSWSVNKARILSQIDSKIISKRDQSQFFGFTSSLPKGFTYSKLMEQDRILELEERQQQEELDALDRLIVENRRESIKEASSATTNIQSSLIRQKSPDLYPKLRNEPLKNTRYIQTNENDILKQKDISQQLAKLSLVDLEHKRGQKKIDLIKSYHLKSIHHHGINDWNEESNNPSSLSIYHTSSGQQQKFKKQRCISSILNRFSADFNQQQSLVETSLVKTRLAYNKVNTKFSTISNALTLPQSQLSEERYYQCPLNGSQLIVDPFFVEGKKKKK